MNLTLLFVCLALAAVVIDLAINTIAGNDPYTGNKTESDND